MRRNGSTKAPREEIPLHLRLRPSEMREIDDLIAKNPGILNRSSIGRALVRLGLAAVKKDPAQLVAPST